MVRGESHVLYLNIIIRTRFKWFENWSNCNVMEISENLMQSMCAFFIKSRITLMCVSMYQF